MNVLKGKSHGKYHFIVCNFIVHIKPWLDEPIFDFIPKNAMPHKGDKKWIWIYTGNTVSHNHMWLSCGKVVNKSSWCQLLFEQKIHGFPWILFYASDKFFMVNKVACLSFLTFQVLCRWYLYKPRLENHKYDFLSSCEILTFSSVVNIRIMVFGYFSDRIG